MGSIDLVTLVVIVANVLISIKGFNDFAFFERYKFNIAGIRKGEQIRFFSSGFLHADFSHLLFNMLALFFFAGDVIYFLGVTRFLVIYLGSLLAGNLLSYYFHKNEYHYSAVGASGAVMGILYSSILFNPYQSINFIPAWLFGLIYLGYSIYGMKKRIGNIGHDAHIGGALAGYLATLLFAPYLFETRLWLIGLMGIPIVVLVALTKSGKL